MIILFCICNCFALFAIFIGYFLSVILNILFAYAIEQKELKKREIEPKCTRSAEALSSSVNKNAVYVLEKFEDALFQKLVGKTRYGCKDCSVLSTLL